MMNCKRRNTTPTGVGCDELVRGGQRKGDNEAIRP